MRTPRSCILIIAFLLLVLSHATAGAVVYPGRSVLLNPLAYDKSEPGWNFFPFLGGWAEGGHYIPAGDKLPDHTWNTRLGAAAEVLRRDNAFDLVLASDVELVADSHSSIGFNPRAFFWQQVIMVSGHTPPWGWWQTGIVHRCKHDIDTLGLSDETGRRRETVMIYDSLFLGIISRSMSPSGSSRFPFALQPFARFDIFVIRDDSRIHDAAVYTGNTVEDLAATLEAGVNCNMVRLGPATFYLRGRYMMSRYSSGRDSGFTSAGSCETGVAVRGGEGVIRLFAMIEYQDMTMINPYNESKLFFLLGLRLCDGRMYE